MLDYTFDIISCLHKPTQTVEMKDQIVKNLLFMLQSLLNLPEAVLSTIDISKLFKKSSYLGRMIMLDIKTSVERLETIL